MGVTLGVLAVFIILVSVLSLLRRHASVVDPFWVRGFAVAALSRPLSRRSLSTYSSRV
jgi:hypothetical protein